MLTASAAQCCASRRQRDSQVHQVRIEAIYRDEPDRLWRFADIAGDPALPESIQPTLQRLASVVSGVDAATLYVHYSVETIRDVIVVRDVGTLRETWDDLHVEALCVEMRVGVESLTYESTCSRLCDDLRDLLRDRLIGA